MYDTNTLIDELDMNIECCESGASLYEKYPDENDPDKSLRLRSAIESFKKTKIVLSNGDRDSITQCSFCKYRNSVSCTCDKFGILVDDGFGCVRGELSNNRSSSNYHF